MQLGIGNALGNQLHLLGLFARVVMKENLLDRIYTKYLKPVCALNVIRIETMHPHPVLYDANQNAIIYNIIQYSESIESILITYGHQDMFFFVSPTYLPRFSFSFCRESAAFYIHQYKRYNKYIAYKYDPQIYGVSYEEGNWNIARWFWYIEGHMNWELRTKVYRGRKPDYVLIELSEKWFDQFNSVSLFSLMLRLAPYCKEGISLNEVLDKHKYSVATRDAIWRFLSGCTHYTGKEIGWMKAMTKPENLHRLDRVLINRADVEDKARQLWREEGEQRNRDGIYWQKACDFFALSNG